MSRPADIAIPSIDRTRARRGLAIFFSLVVVFEAALVTTMMITQQYLLVYALMWSVALASVIARLVLRDGFADVSFRLRGDRRTAYWFVVAVLYPQVIGAVAFGVAWLTGIASFTAPPGGFWIGLLFASTVGTLVGCLSAAGEEIGWRGYMLTRLIDAGVPRPVLVSGVIWGLWHTPLIFAGLLYTEHPSRLLAALVFVVAASATSCVFARARLETGSIWPCILLHGAYNTVIQSAYWSSTSNVTPGAAIWIDMEAGLLVMVILVAGALVLCRGRWTMRRTPDEPMDAAAAA